jgi:hypothetical protein
MPLTRLTDSLWIADGPIVDFYGCPYPTRMVLARLPAGMWVWSPIPLDEDLRREVDALGEVAWLVSPNKIHHLFLDEWHTAYPEAKLCGLTQVAAKRSDLDFDLILDDAPPPEWAQHLDQVVFRGSVVMEEIVFFHRPSHTAIFADLIENFEPAFLEAHWKSWQVRMAKLAGITAPEGKAPLDFRASFLRRKQARAALARVRSWAPQRVIMAHGRWIDDDAGAFLDRSFAWLAR